MARGQTSQSEGGSLARTRCCVKSPWGTGWGEVPEQQEAGGWSPAHSPSPTPAPRRPSLKLLWS